MSFNLQRIHDLRQKNYKFWWKFGKNPPLFQPLPHRSTKTNPAGIAPAGLRFSGVLCPGV
jgi:hypothetical protein